MELNYRVQKEPCISVASQQSTEKENLPNKLSPRGNKLN
jgi:hypothetical protein